MKLIVKYGFLFLAAFLLQVECMATAFNPSDAKDGFESYVIIQGSSNVNHFEFINTDVKINPLDVDEKTKMPYRKIRIPVDAFTGPGKNITRDFHQMIHARDYPYINIFIEPKEKADFDEETGLTNFNTTISIAGTSHQFLVPCRIISYRNSEYLLEGKLEVKLTDFDIDPPEKVFGTIKVNNEVFINFGFKFHSEEV